MQSYIKLFFSFSQETSALTDAEIGRIVRQMLAYAENGDTDSILAGNERFLFPVYKTQIDRDVDRYSAVSELRATSGRAGGRKRAKPIDKACASDSQAETREAAVCFNNEANEANASKTSNCFSSEANEAIAFQAKQIKQNAQEEEKEEEDEEKELSITSSTTVAAVIQGAHARDDGGDTIEAYASGNLQVLSPGNMEELQSFAEDLPDELIRYAIDTACANGIRKWAYVRAILSAWRERGIHTLGAAKAENESRARTGRSRDKPGAPENPALQYEQRTYTDDDFARLFVDLSAESEVPTG